MESISSGSALHLVTYLLLRYGRCESYGDYGDDKRLPRREAFKASFFAFHQVTHCWRCCSIASGCFKKRGSSSAAFSHEGNPKKGLFPKHSFHSSLQPAMVVSPGTYTGIAPCSKASYIRYDSADLLPAKQGTNLVLRNKSVYSFADKFGSPHLSAVFSTKGCAFLRACRASCLLGRSNDPAKDHRLGLSAKDGVIAVVP